MFGLIEGFYGPPWSWAARAEVMRVGHERGLDLYLYGPKDDPLHRERWREPYPPDELDGFAGLVAEDTMRVGFAISPGLSIDVGLGRRPGRPGGQGRPAAGAWASTWWRCCSTTSRCARAWAPSTPQLTAWLHDHLAGRAVADPDARPSTPAPARRPTSTPWPRACPTTCPSAGPGAAVVCDEITVAEARARADAPGRPAAVRLGQLPGQRRADGRPAVPRARCGAASPAWSRCARATWPTRWCSPGPRCCRWPRWRPGCGATIPESAWRDTAEELGWLVFAEACDGERPRDWSPRPWPATGGLAARRARGLAARRPPRRGARAWRTRRPWLDQARAEARLGLRRGAPAAPPATTIPRPPIGEEAMGLALGWQALRRSAVTVMGPRCSVRPILCHDDHGEWQWDPASVQVDGNAIDRLVRRALGSTSAAAAASSSDRHADRWRPAARRRAGRSGLEGGAGRTRGCGRGGRRACPRPAGRGRPGPR